MLKSLKDLLDALLSSTAAREQRAGSGDEHQLRLATAVLLVEVMRADTSFHPGERELVRAALTEKFALAADEAERLAELAETTARQATDLFSFTSRVDTHFSLEHKVRMVELMWGVAYADGHLADHERHTLWRVADLLHVPQGAYALARQRARDAATPGPGVGPGDNDTGD
jgi:uncharacterized tellurite resistance protein B-like protein